MTAKMAVKTTKEGIIVLCNQNCEPDFDLRQINVEVYKDGEIAACGYLYGIHNKYYRQPEVSIKITKSLKNNLSEDFLTVFRIKKKDYESLHRPKGALHLIRWQRWSHL